MTRRAGVAVLVALAVGAGGACGVGGEDTARSRNEVPFGLLDPEAEPVVPTVPQTPVGTLTVCYVDEGGGIVPLRVPVDERPSPDAAIDVLGAVPSQAADTLSTAVPQDRVVDSVEVSAGVATVDLTAGFAELVPPADQLRFVAQLVCTLTALPGIGQVAFSRVGQALDVPTGDGTLASGPVSRDQYEELIEPAR
jgi:spore germination protein GerM